MAPRYKILTMISINALEITVSQVIPKVLKRTKRKRHSGVEAEVYNSSGAGGDR